MKLAPQNPQVRVIARPPSLRNGVLVIDAPLPLTLCQGPFEAERVRARLDDVGTVGDAIQHRFAQPRVGDDLRPLLNVNKNCRWVSIRTAAFEAWCLRRRTKVWIT